jgi:hypothetical protein
MAVDGTVVDVPDTEANAGVLGYPASSRQPAFSQSPTVLVEAGTHLLADALMCPYRMGERVRRSNCCAQWRRDAVDVGSRAAFGQMVRATLKRGCHILGRVPANVKLR